MENERWRTRAKMQAVWTAVAAAGLDVFDESDGEASGEEGDDA